MPQAASPVKVVQAINEQRGCSNAMQPATAMGETPVDCMTADERKREYYFLLEDVLPPVMEHVRDFRSRFPHGIVEYDGNGDIVSGLASMEARVRPLVEAGDFLGATYWVHDAIYRTIDIATERWLAGVDTNSAAYQRINSLVDDPRQASYGGVAIQKRVSSAANQTVLISCSFQQMTARLFPEAGGRAITPAEMSAAHDNNIRFAMPMTQFHLLETRPIRKVLGSQALPGGQVEVYTNPAYFVFEEDALHPRGMRMVESMAAHAGTFPDGRIGCPGAQYIPEIWQWTGEVSKYYAMPALAPPSYEFGLPGSLPQTQ
jgi:hypothetical protein